MRYAIIGTIIVLTLVGILYWMSHDAAIQLPPQIEDEGTIRFGFIRAVDGDTIVFDEARWLTDREGEDAAIKAGICTEETRSDCLPNNFFIENISSTTEELHLAPSVLIAMATLHMEKEGVKETHITREEFGTLINDASAYWSQLPYQMLVKNGEITILEEVYVP